MSSVMLKSPVLVAILIFLIRTLRYKLRFQGRKKTDKWGEMAPFKQSLTPCPTRLHHRPGLGMCSKSDPSGNVSLGVGNDVIILQTSYLELGNWAKHVDMGD